LGKFLKVLQSWYCCGHIVYFTPKLYILWPFGTFCGHLVYFPPVLVYCNAKIPATLTAFAPIEFYQSQKMVNSNDSFKALCCADWFVVYFNWQLIVGATFWPKLVT
jgi:hypothetical protein